LVCELLDLVDGILCNLASFRSILVAEASHLAEGVVEGRLELRMAGQQRGNCTSRELAREFLDLRDTLLDSIDDVVRNLVSTLRGSFADIGVDLPVPRRVSSVA
jgi:hypothetical protein